MHAQAKCTTAMTWCSGRFCF